MTKIETGRRVRSAAAAAAATNEEGIHENPLWYKDAVIYELHVRAFADSNADGIGDFKGLVERLDYLQQLGVTAIWLLPFYPSPLRDDGYDIADYDGVNPSYGRMRDVQRLIEEAHRRDLRVITELVINHTSDQHAWFQRARRAAPGTPERDFYVWSDTADKYPGVRIIFQDTEKSNWTWDDEAGAYYWHRFFSHQPDLNFDNPAVQEAVFEVMERWFEMGIDGMRLDAVPYLFEREGTNCENLPETHEFLRTLRTRMERRFPDRMLLAEANQWPEDAIAYFGDGDECHMNFHFPLMPRLFMSLQMEDRFPLIDILEQTPPIPDNAQWAIFLRNHDELTLEMVTDEERDFMYRVYAEDRQARINLGIRRRLAPLLDNDRRKIELLNGLLFSLPGTPVLYYGDEIGMGDNIYLGDRDSVRTPMQWSGDRNAGFSRANPQKLFLPVIIDPEYHYETVNVESQLENQSSLLWWTRRIISLRKKYPVFGRGTIEFLHPDNPKVLAYVRSHGNANVLVVANLSRFPQAVELDLANLRGHTPIEMFGRTPFPPIGDLPYFITLSPHSFYWFELVGVESETPGDARGPATVTVGATPERWLQSEDGLAELAELLAEVVPERRWFASKTRAVTQFRIEDLLVLGRTEDSELIEILALADVAFGDAEPERYALPLALGTGERAVRILGVDSAHVLAELYAEEGPGHWTLYEGMADPTLVRNLVTLARDGGRTGAEKRELAGSHTSRARETLDEALLAEPRLSSAEQSNTSVMLGDHAIIKVFRRLERGVNPDLEIGRHLTDAVGFAHSPQVLGALELERAGEEPTTVGIIQAYVPNEGSAWDLAVDQFGRGFERVLEAGDGLAGDDREDLLELARAGLPSDARLLLDRFVSTSTLLGERTGEMHIALSDARGDRAFAVERFDKLHQRSLYQQMRNGVRRTLQLLRRHLHRLEGQTREDAERTLSAEGEIIERLARVSERPIDTVRIRCHGDYHLGQVLWTGRDFQIIDFEGEPARSLGERRLKRSALSDVAGMLRSLQYAAFTALDDLGRRGTLGAAHASDYAPWARRFERWIGGAFLDGYLGAVADAPTQLVPRNDDDLRTLLVAWQLEKAMYEVRYELNSRPDWVRIPLHGVLELLEEPAGVALSSPERRPER